MYVDVALTMRDELERAPERRVTGCAVSVRPEVRVSTGVDVLV